MLGLTARVNDLPQSHLRQLSYCILRLFNLLLREPQESTLLALDFSYGQRLRSKLRHSSILCYLLFYALDQDNACVLFGESSKHRRAKAIG